MYLAIWNDIWNKLNDLGELVKNFFIGNERNPILWVGIIIIGLVIFEVVYKKLHKD